MAAAAAVALAVIVGTAISLLGALMLSISVEAVGGLLPDAWQPLLHWHWP